MLSLLVAVADFVAFVAADLIVVAVVVVVGGGDICVVSKTFAL